MRTNMPPTGDRQVNEKPFRIAINLRESAPFYPLDLQKTAIKVTVSINFATTCVNSRVTDLSSVTEPATPTASPRRVSKSRCSFYSSTNVWAAHSPTAASTTGPTQNIAQTVSSKPPTTAPTKPSIKLSNCWQPPERHTADINVKVVLSKNREVRIYAFSQTGAAKKGPLRGSLKSRPHCIYRALHGRRAEHSLSGSPERQL